MRGIVKGLGSKAGLGFLDQVVENPLAMLIGNDLRVGFLFIYFSSSFKKIGKGLKETRFFACVRLK